MDGEIINVVRFIGTTAASFDIRQLIYNICVHITTVIGAKTDAVPNTFSELQSYFLEVLERVPDNRTLVIFIDSLHMLVPQYGAHNLYWMPRYLKENVKIVVSTLANMHGLMDKLIAEVVEDKNNFVEIPPMSINECMTLLKTLLAKDGRVMSTHQQATVVHILQHCSYPLYVYLLHTYVRYWTSNSPVDPTVFPNTIKECIDGLFDFLEQKYGQELVGRSMAYLTASTTGNKILHIFID